jgi:hypothetical protein
MKINTLIFYLIVLLLAGCTHTELWEKTDGNQHSFDLDSRECELIAQKVSLQQSETGKRIDPAFFSKAYIQCLAAKGWSKKAVAPKSPKSSTSETVQQLAELTDLNNIRGFGQTITMPDTYKLHINKQLQNGPTIMEQFFWKGEDSSYINILFQENTATTFDQIPYPVSEPYSLYTSGEGEKSRERLQWATFWGQTGTDWIMGIGAYYSISKKERIIIVITKPLAPPSGTPPENTILTRNQFLEIEQFSEQWQLWLNQQFQDGPGVMKQIIQALKFDK